MVFPKFCKSQNPIYLARSDKSSTANFMFNDINYTFILFFRQLTLPDSLVVIDSNRQ